MSADRPNPCPKRAERHRRRRIKVKAFRFSRYASPRYHWRKIVEDVKSARAGLKMWQLDRAEDETMLRHAIRGKLFATFIGGTPVASIGPLVGYGIQLGTGNAFFGVVCGVLLANLFGLLAFQVIWSTTNKSFYERRSVGFWNRWKAMLRDLWPMQWKSIQIALLMNAIMLPLAKLVILLVEWLFPTAVRYIPMSMIVSMTEALLIQSTMIRLMGDLFERHARVMAKRYAPSLNPGG